MVPQGADACRTKPKKLTGVVGHKRNVPTVRRLVLAGLADKLAHVLVVSHEHGDAGRLGFGPHGLQLLDGGRARFFQVDAGAAGVDAFREQARVVGGAAADEGQALLARLGQVADAREELHAVFLFRLFLVSRKLGASGTRGACFVLLVGESRMCELLMIHSTPTTARRRFARATSRLICKKDTPDGMIAGAHQ